MFSFTGEKIATSCTTAICCVCVVWLCVASACGAQQAGIQPSPAATSAEHPADVNRAASPKRHPHAAAGKTSPLFPTDSTARPATVNLSNGQLTVEANNSDLTQILKELSEKSGMTIDGLHNGPRVFGIYGPGNSREVLSALLVGSGYGFIMVGDAAQGAPRALLLTPQSGHTPPTPQVNSTPPDDDEIGPPEIEAAPTIPPSPNPPPPDSPDALGPGAITPAPSPNNLDDSTRMQQNLQRLQIMQEQIQQQQQQQIPPQ